VANTVHHKDKLELGASKIRKYILNNLPLSGWFERFCLTFSYFAEHFYIKTFIISKSYINLALNDKAFNVKL